MTSSIDDVTDISPRIQYTAAVAQQDFDYPFPIFDDSDLVVDVDGVTQALTTNYTVTGAGADTGGTVSVVTPMAGGELVTIYRDTAIERTSDYQQNGPLRSSVFNNDLDKLVVICQELKAKIGRAIRIPVTAQVNDDDVELTVANYANKYLTLDSNGKPTPAVLSSTTITQAILGNLLFPHTAGEGTVVDYAKQYGDVRRFVGGAVEQSRSWYCYGHTATYVSATQFNISGAGDVTSIYKCMTRVLVLGTGGTTGNLLVISSSYSAGVTSVVVVDDSVSPLPNPIVAVSVQVVPDAHGPSSITYSANYYNGGVYVSNLNTGSSAVGKQLVNARNADGTSNCAIGLVAVPSTYTHDGGSGSGVYLTSGFSAVVSGAYAVLYSQTGCHLDIGTADTSRISIPKDGSAIVVKTDLTINAGNGTTARTNLTLNGLTDSRLALNSNSAEKGFVYASATEISIGTNAAIPFSIITDSTRRLTIPAGGLGNYANDAAAAGGGVPVGSMYRNGSVLMIRVA